VLGYAIILGSLGVKVPQIMKIAQNKSAEGLSMAMFILELVGYSIAVAYNYSKEYPFSTYGENLFVAVQNILILYYIFKYTTNDYTELVAIVAVLLGFFYASSRGVIPPGVLSTMQGGSIFIFTASRFPQILKNYQTQSTGQLAFTTFFVSFLGSIARIFTTMKELGDPIVLTGYILGACLNGAIVGQIMVYGDKKKTS